MKRSARPDSFLLSVFALAVLSGGCGSEAPLVDPEGKISVEKDSIDFGTQRVGQRRSVELSVLNIGDVAIDLKASFDTAMPFSVEVEDRNVPPGTSGDLLVIFEPQADGMASGTLTIGIVGREASVSLPVMGLATSPRGTVDLSLIEFPNLLPGTSTTARFVISNVGLEDLDVEVLPVTNVDRCDYDRQNPSPFCVDTPETAIVPIAAGASETIDVTFRPMDEGEMLEGQIAVRFCQGSTEGCEVRVALTGSASATDLDCSPSELDFGPVNPEACAGIEVLCRNQSNLAVSGLRASLGPNTDPSFRIQGRLPFELAPGESETMTVAFCPDSEGEFTGSIRLASTREGRGIREDLFQLSGEGGGPDLDVPEQLSFGTVSTLVEARRRFPVRNRGNQPLRINDASFTGRDAAAYRLLSVFPLELAPGEGIDMRIEATPTVEGEASVALVMETNDLDSGERSIPIALTAELLAPCRFTTDLPEGRSISFESDVGRTQSQTFTLTNSGANDCVLTAVELAEMSGPGLSLAPSDASGRRLQPEERLELELSFTPSAAGMVSGELFIGTTATSNAFRTVPIEAVGR